MVDGGGGAAVVATAAVGGHRAQSTVKSGSRKNERRGGSGGDRDGVWNIQQSNKSGSERNGGFCNGGSGGDRDRVDNGDHDDSGMDDGDGDDDGVILVDGLVKKIHYNQSYPTVGEEERLSSHATAATNEDKDDNARGGSPLWEEEEDHCFR